MMLLEQENIVVCEVVNITCDVIITHNSYPRYLHILLNSCRSVYPSTSYAHSRLFLFSIKERCDVKNIDNWDTVF